MSGPVNDESRLRLTVLGGSAPTPGPGIGCSGYLLRLGRTAVVIDFGPGIFAELQRHFDVRSLDAIVISHMHVDHVLDLLALRHALAHDPVRPLRPLPVWLPPGGADLLREAAAPFDRCDAVGRFDYWVRMREYDPSAPLSLGSLTLQFAPTVHDIPCWAIRVDSVVGAIGYTADTGPSADLSGFFADIDLLIAEATLTGPTADPSRGSLTPAEAGALATACGSNSLLLTHFWPSTDRADALRRGASTFKGRIEVAQPGLEVEIDSRRRA
jgi:ribonuclease BN (tRNA processing enzyme)